MFRQLGLAVLLAAALPAAGYAQGTTEVEGFGGVTVGTSSFGSAASPTFGGRITARLSDNIEVIGEGGRLAGLQSPLFDLFGFSSVGVHVSAWYGEGGVRLIASPHSAVRPYAEATAGFARLSATVSGLPGITDGILDAGVNLIDSTRPLLGVGAGTQFVAGPLVVDLGYRYKQISPGTSIASALNGNNPYRVNQFRVGLGFRF